MQIMEGDLVNTLQENLNRIGNIQFADTQDGMNQARERSISLISLRPLMIWVGKVIYRLNIIRQAEQKIR